MTSTADDNKRRRIAEQQIDHVGVPLWQASTAFARHMIESVQAAGFDDVSVADSELLPYIDLEGVTLTEIAARKGVSRQAVHQSVHSLVKRGYIELVPHPSDARARIVRHTAKGLELVEKLQSVKTGMQSDVLNALGERRVKQISTTLETLAALFETDRRK